jgi:hypothetical protein
VHIREGQANQFVKKVILSEDMVAAMVTILLQLVHPLSRYPLRVGWGEKSMFLSQQLR